MTDRIKGQGRSPIDNSRVMKWKNVSGEEIPAYGVVKLSSYVAADDYFQAVKPDGEGSLHFVNGPVAVAVDAFGGSQMWDVSRIGKTSGVFGDTVGPVADSWEMTTEGTGFVVFSTPDDYAETAALLKDGGGGTHEIWFEILSVTCEADGSKVLYCEPTDYTGSCDGGIPGADEYGNVEVTAKCSDLDPYPVEWLEAGGRVGRATWFFPRGAGYCEARWLLDKMCGSPQCGGD